MISPFGLGIAQIPFLHYRVPDLCVFSIRKLEKETDRHYIWVAPELLVECLSPSNRKGDIAELLADYSSIRVPEVWLFYPELPELRAYQLGEGKLCEVGQAARGVVCPLHFPQAGVSLEELWAAFAAGY